MVCNANTGGREYYIYKIKGTKATRVVKAERFNGNLKQGIYDQWKESKLFHL